MLSMAPLAAVRGDHAPGRTYGRLLARGETKMAALGAVMRKLIILLNRLIKNPNFSLSG